MAGDPFKPVTTGQAFAPSAGVWNSFLDTTRAFKAQKFGQGGVGPNLAPSTSTVVRVHNATGLDLDRGSVLGIGGPLWDPTAAPDSFADEVLLLGLLPSDAHAGAFVITTGPIPKETIGRGVLVGAIWARVLFTTETQVYAEAVSGETFLVGGAAGSAIVRYKEPGTGLLWAIVQLGQPARLLGRYQGILLDDFESNDPIVGCDHVQPIDGGPSCLDDPDDEDEVVPVYNPTGHAGDMGNLLVFRYNHYTQQLETEDTRCPEVT